jgi:hypothetical protein
MRSVYIDESGYTGADLLNPEQPFQAASAIYISEEEAKILINKHFPRLRSDELKYKKLARREGNWDSLLALQKDILDNYECVTYICDKRYVLILHFLDYAVEPFYFDKGQDFYKDGANYALASLAYYAGEMLLGNDSFSEILKLFQLAINSKTTDSISALIEAIRRSNWKKFPECFAPLSFEDKSCIDAIKCKGSSSDAAFVVLFSLISRLEAVMKDEYAIKHDTSKNLEQYDIILQKMIAHENHVSFKKTEATTLTFPLKLKSVEQIDSKKSFGVQLADVLVGGIIDSSKAITKVKVNNYNVRIVNLYKDYQLIHMLPDIDFEKQKMFRRNTEAGKSIDYIDRNFS